MHSPSNSTGSVKRPAVISNMEWRIWCVSLLSRLHTICLKALGAKPLFPGYHVVLLLPRSAAHAQAMHTAPWIAALLKQGASVGPPLEPVIHTLVCELHALISLYTFASLQAAHSLSYYYQGHQRSLELILWPFYRFSDAAVNYATGAIAVLQVGSWKHK